MVFEKSPRDRVADALAHRPGGIPIDFWAEGSVYESLQQALGLGSREEVLRQFGADLRYYNGPPILAKRVPAWQEPRVKEAGDVQYDHWGVGRRQEHVTGTRRDGTNYTWDYHHLAHSPLATAQSIEEIDAHPWPVADMWDFSGVAEACRALRQAGYAVVAGADRLDRTAQLKPAMYLRGTEQFLEDLMLQPDLAECILEHIGDYYLAYNRRLFEAAAGEIDIFFMGDDFGTQQSTWVSLHDFRRFFGKRFAAYCGLAHEFGIKTMHHTCGYVMPLVEVFVESGLDILQSLQPAAMGAYFKQLKGEFGKDLCFQGGIDIQHVLPHLSPEQVKEHVRQTAALLGQGGGYIFGTAHNVLPDAPVENILALVEAYREFR